ncbi:MAG: glycosyltransferase family 2 protein [Deltaproteobacteria bacterium]|jgi:glycosyltransferase involved in cell wall biosynthesis|nr:glycosyltransferase family 2 protein [Deltaproteobacteria bacterium]
MARSVSCTILAYNEETTAEEAIRDVHAGLSSFGDREFEIIFVDDGSTDSTVDIALRLAEEIPELRIIRHGKNRGPGSAILTGIRNSSCDVICFHAADQQLDFSEVAQFVPLLDEYDIVIGQRSGRPGYTRMRMLSSVVYIKLAQMLFGLEGFDDFNFLYLYRRDLFDDMPIESDGVFMCTEIFVRAVDRGARVGSVEAVCLPRRAGVSSVYKTRVITKTMMEMARFWFNRRFRTG